MTYPTSQRNNIYYESKDLKELEKTVNEELKKLSLWLNINRLALNVGKTNFVIFRSPNKKSNHNVTIIMNKKALQQKDHVKYLGILLDEHLNWKYQVNQVSLKISRGIGILAKLKPVLNDKLLRNIYFSLVYSYLSYGVHAWGSAHDSIKNKILVLQNKAVRILSGVQYFQIYGQDPGPLPSSEPLYRKLEILKFDDIFKLNIANFVYSTLDFDSPPIFHDWFVFEHEIHAHSTRMSTVVHQNHHFDVGDIQQTLKLYKKGCNNNYGRKTLKILGPTVWNSIPEHIVQTSSTNCFKIMYKKFLIDNYDTPDIPNNNNSNNINNRRNGRRFQSRWDLEIGESTTLI